AKLPRLHAIRKRLRLRRQFTLKIAKEFRIVGGLAGVFRAVLLLVPRRRDDIFLTLRNLRLVALPAATSASRFLRLRVIALVWFGLDEVDVGLGGIAGILRRGINAHQVARRELVVLE